MQKNVNTAVILAAGRGTRLQPYTFDIPKGFMRVGDETLIERSLRLLRQNGIAELIVGCGHLKEHYERLSKELGFRTFFSPDFAITGSFHTLYTGSGLIESDFLLLESDLLYHGEAIRQLLQTPEPDVILTSGFTRSNDEVYVEANAKDMLVNLSKNASELNEASAELVGIWKLSLSLLEKLTRLHGTHPDARTMDYERAIALLAAEHPVKMLKLDNLAWCEIDNEQHLERAEKLIYPRLD